jgi:hypothetical protein
MANESKSNGIGFFGALTLLFIGLKLASVINWAWWIVLAPIWGPLAFIVLLFVLALLYETIKAKFFGK